MSTLDALLPRAIAAVCSKSTNPGLWAAALDPFMAASGITTPRRIAAFVGQVAWESTRFTQTAENLNYSAERLCAVWPSHFASPLAALAYEHNPAPLACVVYADRMGNGEADSGDGYTFRGAGLIQLTGRDMHTKFAAAAKLDLATIGDYLRTSKGAAQSAVWFWQTKNLNRYADLWLLTRLSEAVNGGTGGLAERIALCNSVAKAIGA
jgi:putative chitinase